MWVQQKDDNRVMRAQYNWHAEKHAKKKTNFKCIIELNAQNRNAFDLKMDRKRNVVDFIKSFHSGDRNGINCMIDFSNLIV